MHTMKCIRCLLGLVLLILLSPMCTNAQTTNQQSLIIPVEITDLKINNKIFNKGTTVKYYLTIKDLGMEDYIDEKGGFSEIYYNEPLCYLEVDGVYLFWKSSGKQCIVQSFEWTETAKKNGELKISGELPVKKGMKQGKWYLSEIDFQYGDQIEYVGDFREFSGDDDFGRGIDFSPLDFKVSGTGKEDKKAPTIDLKSLKVSRSSVKKNQKSTFSVKVKDSSKVDEVVCIWDIYDKTNKSDEGDYFEFYRMKYNKKTKKYQCSVKLDTKYEKKGQLVGIEVRDIYGNEKTYHSFKSFDNGKRNAKYYKAYKKMLVKAK